MRARTLSSHAGRFRLVFGVLLILLLGTILLSMNMGTLAISPVELVRTILGQGNRMQRIALFTIRLPRIIIALLAGGLCAATLIYALAWQRGMRARRLLLMSIAVNAGFSALIIILQLSFDNRDFNRVLSWTSGSIWDVSCAQSRTIRVNP
jgi:iron complex transport system permease protein